MLLYVITGPEGDDRFVCEDVEVCLANMGEGEAVYAVTYEEVDRELVARRERGVVPEDVISVSVARVPGKYGRSRERLYFKKKGERR